MTQWLKPILASCHDILNPVQEVCDLRVDAVHVFLAAAFPPAHHTCKEPGFLVACHQWAPAVTLASILATTLEASTYHVLGDVEPGVEAALLHRDPRQLQTLQVSWGRAKLCQTTPTRHSRVADACQRPGEGAIAGRKADGHDVAAQFYWAVKFQQSQVAVGASHVVVFMAHNFEHPPPLFCFFLFPYVMLTLKATLLLNATLNLEPEEKWANWKKKLERQLSWPNIHNIQLTHNIHYVSKTHILLDTFSEARKWHLSN